VNILPSQWRALIRRPALGDGASMDADGAFESIGRSHRELVD
jgi:hypothetical protein